jgi:DNA-binding transcriptional MerR regulator
VILEKKYTGKEVSKVTGLTARQLQYWDEKGFIKAEIIGHQRTYTRAQFDKLKAIAEIRRDYRMHLAKLLPLVKPVGRVRIISEPLKIGQSLVIPVRSKEQKKQK